MDCNKIGKLILSLRKEKNMTQKDIAIAMNISDKTISKWERGLGCPDVSLLGELSNILGVNIEKILLGDLDPNDANGGNMKKIKFYVCPSCGNVINSTGEAEVSCCGRKLNSLVAKIQDKDHDITFTEIEDDYYITIEHEMSKTHYISFIAYVGYDRVLLVKLYPEQNAEVRIPKMHRGKLYAYCSQHGLWMRK
ncbi:helix-turn-helix domain-containing protein [Inediibacterium massiliense]|uniref:helix-turn-helix domain-containing protein n=1 Tax=Inediibacterium massiliense TaxID=1658111 RepID=UPI0006B5E6F3|nr:helix-turn-helix domain-containing protein [Inediibacterium massiliense]